MNTPLFDENEQPFAGDETVTYELEEPVMTKGFAVTYDRKFNLGDWESLHVATVIWVKTRVPEGAAFDLHHAKERVRNMTRENVRSQLLRQKGSDELVFLGLQPTVTGEADPIYVRTVSVSLTYKVNLGNYESITPSYTDWSDLRHVSGSSGELHIALMRMWQSLWANIEDEISRAQGRGATGKFCGYPVVTVEDLTTVGNSPPHAKPNGHLGKVYTEPAEALSAGSMLTVDGSVA